MVVPVTAAESHGCAMMMAVTTMTVSMTVVAVFLGLLAVLMVVVMSVACLCGKREGECRCQRDCEHHRRAEDA